MTDRLYYTEEAKKTINKNHNEFCDDDLVWQFCSLPLGNGYFGASVFGYADTERIQITDNSFSNPYRRPSCTPVGRCRAGVTSFANIYLHFGHSEHTEYTRELSLDEGVCRIAYKCGGVSYKREYFTSYPDRVLIMKISSDKRGALSFTLSGEIPYVDTWCHTPNDNLGRTGEVHYRGEELILESTLDFYNVTGYGVARILHNGQCVTGCDGIEIRNADEAVIIFTVGTNYKMESRVFLEKDPKRKLAPYPHPRDEVEKIIEEAAVRGYETLLARHLKDYQALYKRCSLDISSCEEEKPTDLLVKEWREGKKSRLLEQLLFNYGRYLLISSSRRGALPCNLQGVWSNYRSAPWSAGYWHNINVQMNYWPSCVTGLSECFLSYSDYNQAYMPLARRLADDYIGKFYPERKNGNGNNGWTIGTGAWPYTIDGPNGHSGPGTGAFTSLLFWDYYDFTRDKEYLQKVAYPVLRGMSLFFSRTLINKDGKYLVGISASPEQFGEDGSYYITTGCAFDQQMVYENYKRTLDAADALGIDEELCGVIRGQIDSLDPVLIGDSGQIKEFREERFYGDIGEYKHRHISHLVSLFPGTHITSMPEYTEAAKYTLSERGDGSSGWSRAHRALCLARVGDGKGAKRVLDGLITNNIPENLWDQHPPFQIDGNLGYTACVSEMLIQSHDGYINLLPALPEEWTKGEFKGLIARGNFSVDCAFEYGKPTKIKIVSNMGEHLSIRGDYLTGATVKVNGSESVINSNEYSLSTIKNQVIEITVTKE